MLDIHAIHAAAYCVAVDGQDFRFHDANDAALALTGFATSFQPGLRPQDLFAPAVADALVARYRACCAGRPLSYVSSTMVGTEPRRWQTTLFMVAGPDGRPAFVYGICNRIEAVPADLPALALDALDGGFWTFNVATREFETSRRLAEKIAGPGHVSLNLAEYVSYVHADDLSLDLPDGEHDVTVEFRIFTYDGRMRWFQTRRRPVRDASGRPTHVVGVVLDITESKLALRRLKKEAATDMLTRVGNRRAFERAAERCFDDESRSGFGVVVIDLDGFKAVNDRHGHRAGDDLLREAGGRLADVVAPGELLARIGGDEFALLLPAATPERIDALVRHVGIAFVQPFVVGGAAISVGASCGHAVRSAGDRSVGDIVARADQALYAVKDGRRRLIG